MSHKVLFGRHTDSRTIVKKDRMEVQYWCESLEAVNTELDYIISLEKTFLNDPGLFPEFQGLRRENVLNSAIFYRYDSTLRKAVEYDNLTCDAFYIHKYERHRSLYLEHMKKFSHLKLTVLSRILKRLSSNPKS